MKQKLDTDFSYFVKDIDQRLGHKDQKYCRCILHVASQQPPWCLAEQAWKQNRDGKSCYNPYSVCTSSVRRTGQVSCFLNYLIDNIPSEELQALILLKKKKLEATGLPLTVGGLKSLKVKEMGKFSRTKAPQCRAVEHTVSL